MDRREQVRTYYGGRIAQKGCCTPATGSAAEVPSFGCGAPTAFADLKPGETVLDLGSGAGLDCFRAAALVGETGRVVGVDMTPEMLVKAREGVPRLGFQNVEFREGFIEALPIASESVDVALSNCVVNLSPDKRAVFAEVYRVLRPGGRVAFSDTVRSGPAAEQTEAGWCACEDGADDIGTYGARLAEAGFIDISVAEKGAFGAVYSAQVKATKPVFRTATPDDLGAVKDLLRAAGLPLAGLEHTRLWLLEIGGQLVGTGSYEPYGSLALLRSLAVVPEGRGRGLGGALLRHLLRTLRDEGVTTAYGLTTTVPEWLERLGFTEVARKEFPAALWASEQLRGACPVSARAFRKVL